MNAQYAAILDGRWPDEPETLPPPGHSYYGDRRREGHPHDVAVRLAARDMGQALASLKAVSR